MNQVKPFEFLIKKATALILAVAVAFSLANTANAEEGPFENLAESTVSYFTPVEGAVTAVGEDTISSDIGTSAGIREGMRLTITRKGAPFVHPITKEKLGLTESHIGRAEVVEAGPDGSTLKVLSGEPEAGDILRLTSAAVRTLFFQSSDVDWNVSEEYYDALKDTGRFELIDTAPGIPVDETIIEQARDRGAEVALVLTSAKSPEGLVLKQRLLWVEDGATLSAESVTLSDDLLADLKLGSDLFTPKKDFIITFVVPSRTNFIASGDIDGDGAKELLLGDSNTISFHNAGGSLEDILGGLELSGPKTETFIWVDVDDLDGDEKDEIIITSLRGDRIISRVYKYDGSGFSVELESNHFLRVIDGALYGQKFARDEGYKGPVFPVEWGTSAGDGKPEALKIPQGINIYDFNVMTTKEGEKAVVAYDDAYHLNLYGEDGQWTWRSPESYGAPLLSFKKTASGTVNIRPADSNTTVYAKDEWNVKDEIHVIGRSAIAIKRIALVEQAKGMGFKNSQVIGLNWFGPVFQETPMIKDVSGNITGLAVIDEKLYLLVNPPMGFDAKKLLKGKSPVAKHIYVYSLKGF